MQLKEGYVYEWKYIQNDNGLYQDERRSTTKSNSCKWDLLLLPGSRSNRRVSVETVAFDDEFPTSKFGLENAVTQ